jgi:hypothetical protein
MKIELSSEEIKEAIFDWLLKKEEILDKSQISITAEPVVEVEISNKYCENQLYLFPNQ